MDHQVNRANLEADPFKRQLNRIQAGFWPMMFTTSTLAAILVCRFFNSPIAIYTSIIFITLLRSFLVAVASAFLRIRFVCSPLPQLGPKLISGLMLFNWDLSLINYHFVVWLFTFRRTDFPLLTSTNFWGSWVLVEPSWLSCNFLSSFGKPKIRQMPSGFVLSLFLSTTQPNLPSFFHSFVHSVSSFMWHSSVDHRNLHSFLFPSFPSDPVPIINSSEILSSFRLNISYLISGKLVQLFMYVDCLSKPNPFDDNSTPRKTPERGYDERSRTEEASSQLISERKFHGTASVFFFLTQNCLQCCISMRRTCNKCIWITTKQPNQIFKLKI